MNDGFGIALGAIAVTPGFQVLPQIPMVVDFTVENYPNAALFIADRLMTSLNVDNAQAAHCQSDILLDKEAVVVGPAVDNLTVHRHQQYRDSLAVPDRNGKHHRFHTCYTPIPWGSLPSTIESPPAHTRSSGCCSTTCSGSEEKRSTFMAELNTSA